METTSIRFAAAARTLGQAARAQRLRVPGFRSPPRVDGVERTVRRGRHGGATVAVRVKGRPWSAVLADLVEGVVVANSLAGVDAEHCRTQLWAALEYDGLVTIPGSGADVASTRPQLRSVLPPPPPPPPLGASARPQTTVAASAA